MSDGGPVARLSTPSAALIAERSASLGSAYFSLKMSAARREALALPAPARCPTGYTMAISAGPPSMGAIYQLPFEPVSALLASNPPAHQDDLPAGCSSAG